MSRAPLFPPLPPQPTEIWDVNPFQWGTIRNNSQIPDPGWFRKQSGLIGGASFNPYTKSFGPRVTETDLRSTPQTQWIQHQ
jgi:hypothetical protein